MRHVVMDVLSPWVEIDCAKCGLEYDLDPMDVYAGMRCACGYVYTKADITDRATLYAHECDE